MAGRKRTNDAVWIRSVFERYEGPLVRYAARLTGDVETARDVVQDTFLRLCRAERAKVEDHVAAWLFTVCRRRCLDVAKKQSRIKTLDDGQAAACESREDDHTAAFQQRETAAEVLALLDTLSANQQEVVRLKFQNGLSYREISRITGLSVSNVGFQIHAAVKKIRQLVSQPTTASQRE